MSRSRFRLGFVGLLITGASIVAWSFFGRKDFGPGRLTAIEDRLSWSTSPNERGAGDRAPRPLVFRLRNDGGSSVRVTSLESGCGCARPTVEPLIVAPGQECRVTVASNQTQTIGGERLVPIKVGTDSHVTPTINLSIRIFDERTPPFIGDVDGALSFNDPKRGDSQEFNVRTVEPVGQEHVPLATIDLPFLKVEHVRTESSDNPALEKALYKIYIYNVSVAGDPPPGDFLGTISVQDPYAEGKRLTSIVRGKVVPLVRVVLRRGLIRTGLVGDDSQSRVLFTVFSKALASGLELKAPAGSPLLIQGAGERGRSKSFEVRWDPNASTHGGVYELTVIDQGRESASVPIEVRQWEGAEHDPGVAR